MSTDDLVTVKRSDLEKCLALAQVGGAALRWDGISTALGHVNPLDSVMYIHPESADEGAQWFHAFMKRCEFTSRESKAVAS
jgi:hypothetical protein